MLFIEVISSNKYLNYQLAKKMKKVKIILTVLLFLCLSLSAIANGISMMFKDIRRKLKGTLSEQIAGIEQLQNMDHARSAEFIVNILRKKKTPFRVCKRAALILGSYKSNDVQKYMMKYMQKHSSPSPFVLDGFSRMGIDGSEKIFLRIIIRKKKKPVLVGLAVQGLGYSGKLSEKTVSVIVDRLKPEYYHCIRKTAAVTLGKIENKKGLQALLKMINDKVIGEICIASLRTLSREDFGDDKAKWHKWWQQNGNDFVFKKSDSVEKVVEKVAEGSGNTSKKEENNPLNSASFYSIRITGQNILFLLDKSGSMAEKSDSLTRIEHLKVEFLKMLESMNDSVKLGIVFFGGDLRLSPSKGTEIANESFKAEVSSFLEKIAPGGGTPIGAAVTYAFKKIIIKNNIDTIYLLSDGDPDNPEGVVIDLINRLNCYQKVTINTISIGQYSPFLKSVADGNNGSYHDIQ